MRRRRGAGHLVALGLLALLLLIGVVFGVRTVLDVNAPSASGQVVRVASTGRYWVRFVTDQGQACENDLRTHGSVQPGQTLHVRYYPPGVSNCCGSSS